MQRFGIAMERKFYMSRSECEQVVEVLTYDGKEPSGFNPPTSKIRVKSTRHGVCLNLLGGVKFGPSIYVERRPEGFEVLLDMGDDYQMSMSVQDDGRLIVKNETGSILLDYISPKENDENKA